MALEDEYTRRCELQTDINRHLPMLSYLANNVRHITEFGIREGHSTVALAYGHPQEMVSYDIEMPPINLIEMLKIELNYKFFIGNSIEVEIEPTDLLMIDSYHTYEHLTKELTLHAGKVGKYIVIHDTITFGTIGEDGSRPGLLAAIREFLQSNPEWKFHYHSNLNNGLTVLERAK